MSQLSVTDAVIRRRAVRAFSDKPVPEDLLREIIELASHSPSGSNIQPWKIHALTGSALSDALEAVQGKLYAGEMETPVFPTYPENMVEPYRERRYSCGERMYTALGIPREDKGARVMQVMKNYQFFGAPVGIIITTHITMGEAQALDIGIFANSLMLLAKERGLDTCPQVSWTLWPKAVGEALGLDNDEKVMLGISLGYAEDNQPVNELQHPRAELETFASLRGF